MNREPLNLNARLGLNHYEIDPESCHIQVDLARCRACNAKPCLTACPAQVYLWVEDHMALRYENCLECGTCQVACDRGGEHGLTWRNPTNGFGIQFRWG